MALELHSLFAQLRQKSPLVHCITNYITAGDCANFLVAAGASPVMADGLEEVTEVAAKADGLDLNIGIIDGTRLAISLAAGRSATRHGRPCVLDPVGAGFSSFRGTAANRILTDIPVTAIRGNGSEIAFLLDGQAHGRGVDSDESASDSDEPRQALAVARDCALKFGCLVGLSGPVDVITDGHRAFVVRNGHPMLARISGSGCMLSAFSAACLASCPDHPLEALAAAFVAMGICGELAAFDLNGHEGPGTFRPRLIDAVGRLDTLQMERLARYEHRVV